MVIYFLLIGVGLYIAFRLILGELRKEKDKSHGDVNFTPPIDSFLPVENCENLNDITVESKEVVMKASLVTLNNDLLPIECSNEKLEELLKEKNAEMSRLKVLLDAERKGRDEFEKIKNLLQWQIFESRRMNREVQRELQVMQDQLESQLEEEKKLRAELVYKDQLLLKKDYQLTDLNNALQSYVLSQKPTSLPEQSTKN